MAKEVLIYGYIGAYSAGQFISTLEENKGSDINIRLNTDGGSPEDAWGMVAKLSEHKGAKNFKVDGRANSTGFYMLCYATDSECLDVSTFLIHRAAYESWIERDKEYMTEGMWDNLNKVNASLRKAVEAKINVQKFIELKGVTLDEIFSNTGRVEVTLTANEALQIGLVNRIKDITPEKSAEINQRMDRIAAEHGGWRIAARTEEKPNNIKMDLNKLKSEHPALFAEVEALGVAKERDRVGALLAFVAVDAKTVVEAIKKGEPISQTMIAEFTQKQISASVLGKLGSESADEIVTDEVKEKEKTAKAKEIEAFQKAVYENLNIKQKQ